jgi:3-oxoadipyl-CoA thiolase
MQDVFVIDAIRTPIGKYGGALSSIRPDDLLAHVIIQLVQRNKNLATKEIEEVIAGAANQAGEDNRNVARMAALLAQLPTSVAGNTVNRLCASGLQAIMDGARQIAVGDANCIIAGGVESMSRAPYVMAKPNEAFSRTPEIFDTTLGWRFINPALKTLHHPYSMGETAENVAEQWNISRAAQDAFAYNSQLKYSEAAKANLFAKEIVPVAIPQAKQAAITISIDEHPRLSSVEKLAQLKPAFKANGTVTAGNSSGINDGASVLLLCNSAMLRQYNLQPMARIVSMAVAGVDPSLMGIGPVPATQKALQRAGLSIGQIEAVELNEAFASQSIACMKDLNINENLVNVNGGSIALGHPLGASGARISTTLLHHMQQNNKKYGLATMCVGVGQGAAIIYEKV